MLDITHNSVYATDMPMQRVQLVMPQQMLDYLRALAKERGTTVSELVRHLIQEKMDAAPRP